ncbi:hypothetical protein HA402_014135 [Bradysia odoriphaga]|nr:hypothetical protein HA402_014135 [Bradysia odoriphaga]
MCSMKITIALMTLACVTLASAEPPVTNYLPPQAAPSNQYGAPSFGSSGSGYQSQQYNAPSNSYIPPQQNNYSPSASYNAPSFAPQSSYGAPAADSGYGGYGNNEPARYNFEYNVQDYQSGNDFGHMESRDGDRTTGRYYVLLPDGRKQIVNYEADQNGYRPTITYEETNSGYNGNNNNNNNFNGYKK